VSNSRDSLV